MGNRADRLTRASVLIGLLGGLAFILEWLAFFGIVATPPGFLFNNAMVLLLIAIWLKVGALYHKQS